MRRILPLVALASILTAGLASPGAMAQQSIGGMPGNMPSGMSQQLPPGMTPAQAQQMQQQMQQRGGMYGQQQPGQPGAMPSPMERQQTAQAGMGTDMTPIGQPPSTSPDPANCGTPYEPKACPPMPRAPLSNYPASK